MIANTILAVSFLATLSAAFQDVPGTACTTTGSACSYSYTDSNTGNDVTVTSTCAPDGYCADNGASCTTDDNCYDYCGTDGVCGGEGAQCNTQAATEYDQFDVACDTPGFTCTTEGTTGTCVAAASGGSSKTRHRRDVARQFRHAKRECAAVGEQLCAVGEAFECVNTLSSLEVCGGCLETGGQDCTAIAGALDVACVAGGCVVSDCATGFALVDNLCVPL